jgi:hypothetical protein
MPPWCVTWNLLIMASAKATSSTFSVRAAKLLAARASFQWPL